MTHYLSNTDLPCSVSHQTMKVVGSSQQRSYISLSSHHKLLEGIMTHLRSSPSTSFPRCSILDMITAGASFNSSSTIGSTSPSPASPSSAILAQNYSALWTGMKWAGNMWIYSPFWKHHFCFTMRWAVLWADKHFPKTHGTCRARRWLDSLAQLLFLFHFQLAIFSRNGKIGTN